MEVVRAKDLPFTKFYAIFSQDYPPNKTLPCPHCYVVEKAYRILEDELPDGMRIPVIYLEGNDPRIQIVNKIAKNEGFDGIPTPLLYADGIVYVGHFGVNYYQGLLANIIKRKSQ